MSLAAALVAMLLAQTPEAGAQVAATAETVVEIRVHGNHTTPDTEIVRIAGVRVGQPFVPSLIPECEARLRRSGRLRRAEVMKRYGSIEDPTAVVLLILVEEQPGVSEETRAPGAMRRFKAGAMWLPILRFEDGYGAAYGARFSFIDALGRQTRVSVPLSWGGERRASVDVEKRFNRGPLTRLVADAGVTQREHPTLDVADRRTGAGVRAERAFSAAFRVGAHVRVSDVQFGEVADRLRSAGVDATLDTRRDPAFPRNAVYASVGVERLWFDQSENASRVLTDVRGYIGLVRQIVFVARVQQAWSADPLPPFEQPLLGGADSLRGFRLGYRIGDRLLAGSAEVRAPITSPLRVARMGLAVFTDAGTVYGARQPIDEATWDRSIGAGVFVTAPVVSMRLDIAHGIDAGTRAHFTLGVTF